jgi:TonB dependent receptor.
MMGDDNVSGYSAFDFMSGYNYKNGGSVIDGKYTIGTVPRGLPVTTLSWIEAKILDIGFDASFVDGKLTGTFDFFQRKRTGLPASRYDVLIPSEAGFSLPKENLNSDMHLGYDASARWSDKISDLSYSIGANVTYSRFTTGTSTNLVSAIHGMYTVIQSTSDWLFVMGTRSRWSVPDMGRNCFLAN